MSSPLTTPTPPPPQFPCHPNLETCKFRYLAIICVSCLPSLYCKSDMYTFAQTCKYTLFDFIITSDREGDFYASKWNRMFFFNCIMGFGSEKITDFERLPDCRPVYCNNMNHTWNDTYTSWMFLHIIGRRRNHIVIVAWLSVSILVIYFQLVYTFRN